MALVPEIVSDRHGTSYRFPNQLEDARPRGPPGEAQFADRFGPVLPRLPWQYTLVEAQFLRLASSPYSVFMAHADGPEDGTVSFREASAAYNYLHPEDQSNIQHVVLPWTSGPPGEATTTLHITTGGDTEQYNAHDGPYRFVTPKEHIIEKVVPAGVAWCVSFNFVLDTEKPLKSKLYSRLELYDSGISTPNEWLDALQIRIMHGAEPKYLCVAYRVIDTNVELQDLYYVKPILFTSMSVELQGEGLDYQRNVLRSVYRITLSREEDKE